MLARLKPGGFLMVATPNASSLAAHLRGCAWKEAKKPGYIILFTAKTPEALLWQCGLTAPPRLRWFIEYSQSPLHAAMQYVFQALRLEGQLRLIAKKS